MNVMCSFHKIAKCEGSTQKNSLGSRNWAMTAETDFGDPASSVQSAVQGSINDYRLTLFITSS
ncbi:hypothetical protein TCAL_15503, partial [Tigriopus californicus]